MRSLLGKSTRDQQFDFWYPNWSTWKFRRTLSFWIAITYIEGSLLFLIGGLAAMLELGSEQALITTPYFVGSICFTLGSYAGLLEVLNIHH